MCHYMKISGSEIANFSLCAIVGQHNALLTPSGSTLVTADQLGEFVEKVNHQKPFGKEVSAAY